MTSYSSMFETTFSSLRKVWQGVTDSVGGGEKLPQIHESLSDEDIELIRTFMHACLEAKGGAVSARLRAAQLGQMYLALNDEGRKRFLQLLARDFAVNRDLIYELASELHQTQDDVGYLDIEQRLRTALVSPRMRLLQQFNALPQGVKFLVDLRADLLSYLDDDPLLASLDREFIHLLEAWFDIGFLELRHITWDSPAALLEKLIAYEAVHQISSWEELRNRLESDRRCYAFFHPNMPDEPLIFVEVALVSDIADNVQNVLNKDLPSTSLEKASTAIFYSISNSQKGLRGINFGNFLIKKVATTLSHEFPNLKTFATLSPIPNFHKWLDKLLLEEGYEDWDEPTQLALLNAAQKFECAPHLSTLLKHPRWFEDPDLTNVLQKPLLQLCSRYLHEKRADDRPRDAVARFHLGNGARVERLNWLANTAEKGLEESCGIMVNYLYDLQEVEKNHEAFVTEGVIASSQEVKNLLKAAQKTTKRKPILPRLMPQKE